VASLTPRRPPSSTRRPPTTWAGIYQYLADPTDPAKVFVFQKWPNDDDFAAWSQQPPFTELLDKGPIERHDH
jgi:hypothetical protein